MDVLKDLWRDKPLLIAVLAAVAVFIWIVYKSNPGNIQQQSLVQPGNFGNTNTYPEGQVQIIQPAPVTVIQQPVPTDVDKGFRQKDKDKPQPPPPPTNSWLGVQASYGLLGPGAVVNDTTYTLPGGQTGNIHQFLTAQGLNGGIRQGSQGRVWDVVGNIKYLITSGFGPEVNNPYGTSAL